MVDDIQKRTVERMQKSVEALRHELAKIRTGRAHPSLLEHVKVDYYGSEVPISQVANVTAEDARTLSVTPWEKNMVAIVDKAIRSSDLGLNPATSGMVIRVPMPPLTEQRRKELIKVVRHEGENGKVAIRNIRRDAIEHIKKLQKDGLSEDTAKDAEADIQDTTNRFIAVIEKHLAAKEKEIMAV